VPSDNDKPALLIEWLNRLWLPVTGFIGAVVVIVNFIQLWSGNKGLVTWVTIGLGYIALLFSIWHFAFSKKQSKLVPSLRIIAYPSIAKFAQTTFVIVILVTIISSGILLRKSTPTKIPDSAINPTSTRVQACQGVDIYFEFISSKGQTLIKCPDEKKIVTLSYRETGGLTNLSGQAIGPAITNSKKCEWEWYTNKDSFRQTILSPRENCSFSINLADNVTSIYLKLVSEVNQPFFTLKIRE